MEKLYNNIILQDDFAPQPNDAQAVPYLQNPPKIIDVTVAHSCLSMISDRKHGSGTGAPQSQKV